MQRTTRYKYEKLFKQIYGDRIVNIGSFIYIPGSDVTSHPDTNLHGERLLQDQDLLPKLYYTDRDHRYEMAIRGKNHLVSFVYDPNLSMPYGIWKLTDWSIYTYPRLKLTELVVIVT